LMPITPQTVATEGRRVPHKMRGGENRRVRQTFTGCPLRELAFYIARVQPGWSVVNFRP
jgi:hypothetical protein